jgi:mevalonate kinase
MSKAHGKIIWGGEHACLYGCPAIVSDIPLYLEVNDGDLNFLDVDFVAEYLGVESCGVSIGGDLPMGVGLGYSSALVAALYDFFVERNGLEGTLEDKLKCINEFEAFASGVDAFGVTHEGTYFWAKEEVQKLDDVFFDFFVVNTCCEDVSSEMVKSVEMVDGFESCVNDFKSSWYQQDIGGIASAVVECQSLLEQIGAVDDKANEFISWLGHEGIAAKVTGAGGKTNGSGAVVGIGRLTDEQRSTIENDFEFEILYEA